MTYECDKSKILKSTRSLRFFSAYTSPPPHPSATPLLVKERGIDAFRPPPLLHKERGLGGEVYQKRGVSEHLLKKLLAILLAMIYRLQNILF